MITNVTEWLDNAARHFGKKEAIHDEAGKVSFSDIRSKALGIANEIIERGIGNNQPIVVFLEKSAKVITSFMGIAYSRNFYSPIDTDMPHTRIKKILEILNPQLVITSRFLFDNLLQAGYEWG